MRVKLGTIARSGIEQQPGTNLAGVVETAVRLYTVKLKAGRPPLPYHRFFGTDTSRDFGTGGSVVDELEEIELMLDSETEALLRRQAMKHDTDVSAIAVHAVMIYLAEVDFLQAPSRPA